jgi:hypothetical protein
VFESGQGGVVAGPGHNSSWAKVEGGGLDTPKVQLTTTRGGRRSNAGLWSGRPVGGRMEEAGPAWALLCKNGRSGLPIGVQGVRFALARVLLRGRASLAPQCCTERERRVDDE